MHPVTCVTDVWPLLPVLCIMAGRLVAAWEFLFPDESSIALLEKVASRRDIWSCFSEHSVHVFISMFLGRLKGIICT